MVQLYISDSKAKIGFSENRITVNNIDNPHSYPIETIDGVSIFGLSSISTKLIRELLTREIDLQLFSADGHYYGRLSSINNVNASRQKKQALLSDDEEFALEISKKIIDAKLRNQIGIVQKYKNCNKNNGLILSKELDNINYSYEFAQKSTSIAELTGFEGNAARSYFSCLSKLVPEEFMFSGRSKRPPKDPFNSLISLGYSLIFKNIIGGIERHGMNAYFGFMHQDFPKHPTLASDIMEEWRAAIVDDVVMQLLISGIIKTDMFTKNESNGGFYISQNGTRILAKAVGDKMCKPDRYIKCDDYNYTFQYALDLQLQSLARAIDNRNPEEYKSVMV
ncbi:MAG: CRISPR-associated endonuclease Cas1 [Candidatus Ancillula sp.]|nr:CRISPR-associated endonuclease Cas1 [Candidatus Ancillula sp.]